MNIKQHSEVIAEEIKHIQLPDNTVTRLKRKTVVEYLTNRLESLERESNNIQEAEALILKASQDKLYNHDSENHIKKTVHNKRKDTDVYDLEKNIPNT
jgi:esterase/lipase